MCGFNGERRCAAIERVFRHMPRCAGGATGRPTGCNGEGARWSVSGDRSGVGVVCEWAQAVGGVWVARGGGRGKGRKRGRRGAEFDAGRARWWPNCANVIRLTGVVSAPSRAGFATAHRDAISAIDEKSGGAREALGFDVPTAFGGVRAAGIIGESGIFRHGEGLTCGNAGHRLRRWNDSAGSSGAAVMRG